MATIKLSEYLPQETGLKPDSVETGFIQDEAVTKAKLEIDVQSSLGKADSAIQAHQSLEGYATEVYVGNVANTKVDKVAGKGLSDTNFSQAEKDKLAGLESSKYKGQYTSLVDLQNTISNPSAGDYADVDLGVGSSVVRYIYDADDNEWVEQVGASTQLTGAQVKQMYEAQLDTNAYTDSEKSKLAGIANDATNNTGSLADKNSVGTGEIDNNAVTNSKLATVLSKTIKGRTSAGVGAVEDLTAEQARGVIGVNNFYPQAIVKHSLGEFPSGSYYKLASLNGQSPSGGASISWLFTQVGDFGLVERANFIISAIQRGSNNLFLTATSLDNLPIHTGVPRMRFGYVQTGELEFDVYLKQVSYWDTMYVYELARENTAGRVTTNYPLTRTSTEPSGAVWTLNVADISQIVMPTNSKNILQEAGDSPYIAMSQKAVTDALRPVPLTITTPQTIIQNQPHVMYGVETDAATFPASPTTGDKITLIDSAEQWDVTNVTLTAASGTYFYSNQSTFTLDLKNSNPTFIYISPTRGWQII